MLKRFIPVILALFASSASAQIFNPGVVVFDEASQLGRARSLAFVGSSVSCGISGGLATCTFTAPTVGITVDSTTITGGTTGRIAYNNAGTYGESSATINSAGTITLPDGQQVKASGGASSYLSLSQGGGSTFCYSTNCVAAGAGSITLNGTNTFTVSSTGAAYVQGGVTLTLANSGSVPYGGLSSNYSLRLASSSGLIYQGSVALAESATTAISIPVASGAFTGGTAIYTVAASDGTDHQSRSGQIRFKVSNKAGTETCSVYGVDLTGTGSAGPTANPNETQDGSAGVETGTLTYTWGVITSAANTCNIQINPVSSLTQTTFRADITVILNGPGALTIP